MRWFRFTAKNLGRERYLTYTMGEGMEVDEDVLDYCEENDLPQILNIVFEEDEDFDYLNYDVTGRTTISKYSEGAMNKETVLKIIRNVALGMINIKEYALPLSYVILNKEFMYIDPDTLDIKFLYLPVESEGSVSMEFKSFVRQLIAGFIYNVDEDLSYVGQLLTYINGNAFNLRGLIGLTEALMQDSAISFSAEADLSSDEGVEVSNDVDVEALKQDEEKSAMDFMSGLEEVSDNLPEIGDDEDELPADAELLSSDNSRSENEETFEEIKSKLQDLVGGEGISDEGSVSMQKPVRVSRADMVKAAAESIEEENAAAAAAEAEADADAKKDKASKKKDDKEAKDDTSDEKKEEAASAEKKGQTGLLKGKAPEVIDNTFLGATGALKINPYLIRVNTEEKTMINKPVFKIGKASRGVDYKVAGNGAISRQHAIILHKGDSYYIKDNKSTNHTYVDHVMIEGEEEVLLKNNCTITLGDEDFTFKIS